MTEAVAEPAAEAEVVKVKKALLKKKAPAPPPIYLSTGSTLLNLACSGRVKGGFEDGSVVLYVGDSKSGKTFLGNLLMAEACLNPRFKDYRIIFNNSENGARFSVEKFFGPALASRMEAPDKNKDGSPRYSDSVEDWFYHMDDLRRDGRPFVEVLDSMDALRLAANDKKFTKMKSQHRKLKEGKEIKEEDKVAGDYGTAKARFLSQNFSRVQDLLTKTRSYLILICQTRAAVGQLFKKTTRAGGHAMTFYATHELWTSIREQVKRTIKLKGIEKKKERVLGIVSKVKVEKNRVNGLVRTVEIPILNDVGVDDMGSMVNWMAGEGFWKGSDKMVEAPEFEHEGTKEQLIRKIEDSDQEDKLRNLVAARWYEIEDACRTERKKRYA